MKSDVVMVAIVLIWDFIFMVLGLDLVLYIVGYLYILYVTLFRLIVLYSRRMVNRDTNMSVVCVLCNNFEFCFHCAFGLRVWRSQPVGRIPTGLQSAPYYYAEVFAFLIIRASFANSGIILIMLFPPLAFKSLYSSRSSDKSGLHPVGSPRLGHPVEEAGLMSMCHWSIVVMNCVRLVVDCHSRWQGSWVHSATWDCCTIHSPVH